MRHESDIPGVPGHFADLVNGLRRDLWEAQDKYRELADKYLVTAKSLATATSMHDRALSQLGDLKMEFNQLHAKYLRQRSELATYHRELLATKAALAQAEGERDYYRNMAEELAR